MKKLIVANWKMNGSLASINHMLSELLSLVIDCEHEIVICPPCIYMQACFEQLRTSNLRLGGQNCYLGEKGSYTGEISAKMLEDFKCGYVILGHSERRSILKETNGLISKKFQSVGSSTLIPILCVGETKEELEANRGWITVKSQLDTVLETVGPAAFKDTVIAYEPVWAIGTGLTATPEQAQNMHANIRSYMNTLDKGLGERIRILYGGSMKPENAKELLSQKDIDGGLVGGASLIAKDFSEICKAVS